MATVYGVNATKRDNQNVPALEEQGEKRGRIQCAYDTYTSTGAIPLSTKIRLMKIPAGCRVLDVWLDSDDLGTVGTLDVGWEASADAVESASGTGFLNAVDVHSAAILSKMSGAAGAAGMAKRFASEVQVVVNASAATDVAGTLRVRVYFVID